MKPRHRRTALKLERKVAASYAYAERGYRPCAVPYRIVVEFPRYGGRDEIVGWNGDTVATAHTLGWARVLYGRIAADLPDPGWIDIRGANGEYYHP